MFGAHLSVAGGMVNALDEAARLGMDCVQVFTSNQRQWKAKTPDPDDVAVWWARLKELGWHRRRGPVHVVSHNSYLVNLASPDPELWDKSVAAQRAELERCETLGIRACVAHPGAHMGPRKRPPPDHEHLGAGVEVRVTPDERAGLRRIIKGLNRIHRDLPGYRVVTCLETTVGSGTNLGYAFEHLATIRDGVREPERVAFCLDTCHVTAAGYDMTTDRRAAAVVRWFDATCGLRALRVIHVNDSVGAVGSRKDRHAHIGRGACGLSCFRTLVNRRALARVPMILETPKGDGSRADQTNIRRLKGLITRPTGSR